MFGFFDRFREETKDEERKKKFASVKQFLKIENKITSIKEIFHLTEEEVKEISIT